MFSGSFLYCENEIQKVFDQNYGSCFLFTNPNNYSQLIGGNGYVIMMQDIAETLPNYPKFDEGYKVTRTYTQLLFYIRD